MTIAPRYSAPPWRRTPRRSSTAPCTRSSTRCPRSSRSSSSSGSTCTAAATRSSSASRCPTSTCARTSRADARVRIEMRRDFFNAMVEHGARVADWREAFIDGHAKATGVEQYMRLIVQRGRASRRSATRTRKARHERTGSRRPAHAGRVGAARAHADGLALPRGAVGRPARRGARSEYAAVANAVAAFEPVTMVARSGRRRRGARGADRRRRDHRARRSTTRGCATAARSSSATTSGARRRALRLQRLGRAVHAVRPRRGGRRRARRAPRATVVRGRRSCSRAARSRSTARAR